MSALRWGVKASFLGYIHAMSDGRVIAEEGARLVDDGAEFPCPDPSDPLHFRGVLRFTGHGGVLDLRIADPAVQQRNSGWVLSIQDPYDPAVRIDLATVTTFGPGVHSGTSTLEGTGLALTADGADLFFGPYVEGTPLDDFVILQAHA